GWAAAVAEAGIADPRLDGRVDDDVEAGRQVARDLLALSDPPTAVVCASDSLALGAYSAAAGRLSVTGFDDTPVARAVGLSSITQPLAEAAQQCLRQVFDVIADPHRPSRSSLLRPTLTLRASTAQPPDHPPIAEPRRPS
nr:substrate-binding domain-containing protein [Geodermatophilaceae bacterium]